MNNLLTPLELKVMNLLWKLKKAFVKDILEKWPAETGKNKPAYNTISTTIRILEKKGYIGHKAFGRTYQYFPTLSKFAYQRKHILNVLENVFAGSTTSLVSALVDEEKISNQELDQIQNMIDKHTTKKNT